MVENLEMRNSDSEHRRFFFSSSNKEIVTHASGEFCVAGCRILSNLQVRSEFRKFRSPCIFRGENISTRIQNRKVFIKMLLSSAWKKQTSKLFN